MSIGRIYILISLLAFSITNAYGFDKADSLYKVLKIKTIGDYYVIHAQRNDSLFKIVSKKVEIKKPRLEVLREGKYYNFSFGNEDNDTTKLEAKPLVGNANYLHVKKSRFWGDTKIKFTKRFHYLIYTTKDLIGFYYSPN
jgi:hypothetical protein